MVSPKSRMMTSVPDALTVIRLALPGAAVLGTGYQPALVVPSGQRT